MSVSYHGTLPSNTRHELANWMWMWMELKWQVRYGRYGEIWWDAENRGPSSASLQEAWLPPWHDLEQRKNIYEWHEYARENREIHRNTTHISHINQNLPKKLQKIDIIDNVEGRKWLKLIESKREDWHKRQAFFWSQLETGKVYRFARLKMA